MDEHVHPIVNNIRGAFVRLEHQVRVDARTRVGDLPRLTQLRDRILAFATTTQRHAELLGPSQHRILQHNCASLVRVLERACEASRDPPDGPGIPLTRAIRTGKPGRPRLVLNPEVLKTASQYRGPKHLAEVFHCSPWKVRQSQLEYGLAQLQAPVFQRVPDEHGHPVILHNPGRPAMSNLTDEEVDKLTARFLHRASGHGRRMLRGAFMAEGHRLSRHRLADSSERVSGLPAQFGGRFFDRREYNVAGPNALWHHDGQHGLIKYGFVVHGFIDGFSRLCLGIEVHIDNRADTVLAQFVGITRHFGRPSRVRGDHGTENLAVAAWMIENQGEGRGSYIWGLSVHNIRIERLWVDAVRGFIKAWKIFFQDLERHYGLNVNKPSHKWLLRHLFLQDLNTDASAWRQTWNEHLMRLEGQRDQSPSSMYFFAQLAQPRGLGQQDDVRPEDIDEYGVDWPAMEHGGGAILRHVWQNNPEEDPMLDRDRAPQTLNAVVVLPPNSPIDAPAVMQLDGMLRQNLPAPADKTFLYRTQVWLEALRWCSARHAEFR